MFLRTYIHDDQLSLSDLLITFDKLRNVERKNLNIVSKDVFICSNPYIVMAQLQVGYPTRRNSITFCF